MRYIGFDLGDGESCVAYLTRENVMQPRILSVSGSMSFVTAVADYRGETLVGPMALSTWRARKNVAICASKAACAPAPTRRSPTFAAFCRA